MPWRDRVRFLVLPLRCECGLVPAHVRQVGLSAEHQLVIHWRCAHCKKQIYVVKDLADCWQDCPAVTNKSETAAVEFLPRDSDFLHSIGARLPEGEESA
jgi:hypothetical protein